MAKMTQREQNRAIEHLQSIATLAVELQTALRDANDVRAIDLWSDIEDDVAAVAKRIGKLASA